MPTVIQLAAIRCHQRGHTARSLNMHGSQSECLSARALIRRASRASSQDVKAKQRKEKSTQAKGCVH
eukprot:1154832-Pelagomonas_calceolata.AAC.3